MTEEMKDDMVTPEQLDLANKKLGDLEMAGTAKDKLDKLGIVYDELTPEQKEILRNTVKKIISVLGDFQDKLD